MTDKSNNYAIKVTNLHKSFRLPKERSNGLKQAMVNLSRGIKGYEVQKVLRGISFEVKKGDFFGIVGRNGSGKSTLLKTLAGIYEPEKGSIETRGSIIPFIELGVGFNPELTGRENIYLNGALLGFSRQEIAAMYDDIVDFAELHEFMEQKLKNYSSGMQVRLAFSVAIKAQGDILILDEVLAVGDEAFQRKCNDYFDQIRKDKDKTIILVTHNMDAVRRYCTRAIMIDGGEITAAGDTEAVANQYIIENLAPKESGDHREGLSARISSIKVVPISKQLLASGDMLEFNVKYTTTTAEPTYIGISIVSSGVHLTEHNTISMSTSEKGAHLFRYRYPTGHLNDINLQVVAAAFDKETKELVGFTTESTSCYFHIRNKTPRGSWILHERGKWEQTK